MDLVKSEAALATGSAARERPGGIPPAIRYGLALAAAAVVVRLSLAASGGARDAFYILSFLLVVVTAAAAGVGPALLATAGLVAGFALARLRPPAPATLAVAGDVHALLAFTMVCAVAAMILHRERRARQRTEAGRRQLELRERGLRELAEAPVVMAWAARPDRSLEWTSWSWRRLTGLAEDAGAAEWAAAIHPDDRERWNRAHEEAFASRQPVFLEYRLRRGGNGELWVAERAVPRFDGQGDFAGLVASCLDVSERVAGERERDRRRQAHAEEQRRGEGLLAETQRVAHVGSWEWDVERNAVWWSDEMYRIYGLDRASFRPSFEGFLERLPAEDREGIRALIARSLEERGAFHFEHRIQRPDGTQRVVHAQGRVVCDEAGTPRKLTGTGQDITERKRADEERAELLRHKQTRAEGEDNERRYRIIADASELLASSLDYDSTLERVAQLIVPALGEWCVIDVLDHHGQLREAALVHVDPGRLELLRDLKRRFGLDALRPGELAAAMKAREARLASDATESAMLSAARSAEHRELLRPFVPRSFVAVPLLARGRSLGVIGLGSDGRRYGAADLKLVEELARRAALAVDNARLYREVQDASRLKDEFLATLSHELRTPLNAIVGWTHLLRTGLGEAEAARALEVIHRNAMVQNQLIGDVLDVSRIITGRLTLNLQSVNLAEVVEAAALTVQPSADVKQIRLQVLLDRAAGPVTGDAARLQQVVWNLLSNAVKFTPRDGRVQVRLMRINSHVEVAVEDTGVGIRTDFLPYVFERFRQADASTTRAYGGLGLGLALVRYLVELHGGVVSAFSRGEGQGSTFTMKLPLAVVEAGASDERVHPAAGDHKGLAPAPRLDGLRVLVVDDEPDARDLIMAVLDKLGAVVQAVPNAAEALRAMDGERPDVIVSDVDMPDEDGYSFLRTLRALPPERGGGVPAVALTAYARPEDRVRALSAGFQMHVPKPVQPTELAAVIASLSRRGLLNRG